MSVADVARLSFALLSLWQRNSGEFRYGYYGNGRRQTFVGLEMDLAWLNLWQRNSGEFRYEY